MFQQVLNPAGMCFTALLMLLRVWGPREAVGYGGRPLTAA
jgi:hypothetical protein